MSTLAADVLGPVEPRRTVWFVHGILGQGRNWRSFARRAVGADPGLRAVLPDLRCHGRSASLPPPHTLASAAADLDGLAAETGQPDVVVGHSFGGKVILEWARTHPRPPVLWVLDSPPGTRRATRSASLDPRDLIALLAEIAVPVPDRGALREPLRAAGIPEPIIAWLLTSAAQGPDGWHWSWDLDGVRQLLASYDQADLWPLVERSDREIHLVRAARSEAWSDPELERFERLARRGRAHTIENAGHWLHVDAPDALFDLLLPSLTG